MVREQQLKAVLNVCEEMDVEITRGLVSEAYFTVACREAWDKDGLHLPAREIQAKIKATAARFPNVVCFSMDCYCTLLLEKYVDSSFGFTGLFAESDEKNLLSYGNDGDDGHYLYYEPGYPWQRKEYECESEELAKEHLCNVVMPFVLDDTPREDILRLIYQINQVGIG